MEENVSMEILKHMYPENYQYKIMSDKTWSSVSNSSLSHDLNTTSTLALISIEAELASFLFLPLPPPN